MSQIVIPKEWESKKLGEICKIISGTGFPLRYQKLVSEGIPFIKVSDMNEILNEQYIKKNSFYVNDEIISEIHARMVPKNTIIFPKVGGALLTNKRRILSKESCFDNNIMGIVPGNKIDYKFLYYFMTKIDLRELAKSGPVPSINLSDIETIEIPLPSIKTQNKIVQKLDYIFTQLDVKRKKFLELKLETTARLSLLDKKLVEHTISKQVPIKNKSMNCIFKKLSEVCEKIVDPDHKMPKKVEHGIPLISTKDFTDDGKIDFRNVKHISNEDYEKMAKRCKPEFNDIIFSRYGTVGKSVRIDTKENLAISYSLVLLKPNEKLVISDYLLMCLRSVALVKMAEEGIRGIAIPDLGIKTIRDFEIPVPDLKEQQRIVNEFKIKEEHITSIKNHINSIISKQKMILAHIENIQTTILDHTFSGKLVN